MGARTVVDYALMVGAAACVALLVGLGVVVLWRQLGGPPVTRPVKRR